MTAPNDMSVERIRQLRADIDPDMVGFWLDLNPPFSYLEFCVSAPAVIDYLLAELHKAEKRAEIADSMSKTHSHQYWQERQNDLLLYRTLARHAPEALKAVQGQLYQSTNEYDKVESDMVRTVERLQAELARRDAQLARAVAALQFITELGHYADSSYAKETLADIERIGKGDNHGSE